MIGWGPMMGWTYGGFGMMVMGVFWLIILGLIVWGVIALLRRSSDGRTHGGEAGFPASAVDIARARYARGEISKSEYDQLLGDLTR